MLEHFEDLLGKTLVACENRNDEELVFTLTTDEKYMLYHRTVCCEDVSIEDIVGDLHDLVGSPILMAEKVTNDESEASEELPDYGKECFLWTFYKLATVKGYVTVRWYGQSNGYYSMGVDWAQC